MNCEVDNDIWETILKRLYNYIKEDPELSEFSLIPTELSNIDKNRSPVHYARYEHVLGLETWCINYLLRYSHDQIFKTNRRKVRDVETFNMYLTGALLLQPKVTTFWNIKRELSTSLNDEFEMRFAKLVLSNQCKSYEAFTYRRWILERMKTDETILQGEYEVLDKATRNTANNYHAWNHRIWCHLNIALRLPIAVQLNELAYSENWIMSHVSEYSGFHYRQFVLNCFKKTVLPCENLMSLAVFRTDDNSNVVNSMLDSEYIEKFDDIDLVLYNQFLCLLFHELYAILPTLHSNFPGHEAIWYHRRYIIYNVYKVICEIYGVDERPKIDVRQEPPNDVNIVNFNVRPSCRDKNYRLLALESSYLFRTFVDKENDFLSLNGDCELAARHKKWLQLILKIEL